VNRGPMARKIKKLEPLRPLEPAPEIEATDALTVGWMLSVFTTLVCELGTLASYWYAAAHPEAARVNVLCGLLLFTAVVVGLFSLCLLPVVVKMRREAPPLPIMIFAVLVDLSPLATAGLLR
jgi:hypothetical protein